MAADGFVLVHGGYHGAWCWEPVRPLLSLPSIAVDLPGRGGRPSGGKPVTLDACVEAVMQDADAAGMSRFVLVGHSMGGITITETANRHPDRIAHLAYVAALVLEPGSNVFDLYFGDEVPRPDDLSGVMPLLDEATSHQMFSEDLSPEAFADVHRQCVPEAVGLFAATVSGYDSGVPTTYLRCLRDGAVPAEIGEEMIKRLDPTRLIDLDSDHDVMLSHPGLLADHLNLVAREAN
jgi:pimeloyl-ACP methyl ester carboxylesterase